MDNLILAGARSPVSFFAYPGRASDLVPPGGTVTTLAEPDQDAEAALELLADQVAAGTKPVLVDDQVAETKVAVHDDVTDETPAEQAGDDAVAQQPADPRRLRSGR